MSDVREGALVIADISGYTRYLEGVELEHSSQVMAELIGAAAAPLERQLELAKLEGDAVFCHGATAPPRARDLLDAVDASHTAFVAQRRSIEEGATCPCYACQSVAELDLKFVAHHGEYVEHEVAGRRELLGPSIIVAHRLLKNGVGLQAYALLTDELASALRLDPAQLGMRRHSEHYEDVGTIDGWIWDLGAASAERRVADAPLVPAGTESIAASTIVPAAAALVWEALTAPPGREAPGRDTLQWEPPERWSYAERSAAGRLDWSFELRATAERESELVARVRLSGGGSQRFPGGRLLVRRRLARRVPELLGAIAARAVH